MSLFKSVRRRWDDSVAMSIGGAVVLAFPVIAAPFGNAGPFDGCIVLLLFVLIGLMQFAEWRWRRRLRRGPMVF